MIVGLIVAILIVGAVVMYVSMSSPDVAKKIDNVFNERGCGLGTFYHEATNSCETYPEVRQNLAENKDKIIAELERTIRDIRLDVDGHRIVERDAEGLPVVSCTPFVGETFVIDEQCKMMMK